MSVKTQHPEYISFMPKWERCEDAYCGQDAIHAKSTRYLPRLHDQSDSDYQAYKLRALFYNATFRTISGLLGLLTRKAYTLEASKSLEESIKNITSDGNTFDSLAKEVITDVLIQGRTGLLVDYPPVNTDGATIADAQSINAKPYVKRYPAKSIINWRTKNINNVEVLSMAVLQECEYIYKNEFEFKEELRYRVLSLNEAGIYTQRVFKVNDKGEDVLLNEHTPIMNGAPLDYIPFVIINSESLKSCINEPPLIDLINVNIAHYRVTADYEHGCHFTGLPTPVVSGYMPQTASEKLYIGSSNAWVFPDPQAKAFYLEFTGQGLTALENNLKAKQDQMAVLGARMLADEKKMAETATTSIIKQTSENSSLASIGRVLSEGLKIVLKYYSEWLTGDDDIEFELNKDFTGSPITSQDLTALVSAWQAGAISQETLFNNLKAGELYADEETFEDEQAKIDEQPITITADRSNSDASAQAQSGFSGRQEKVTS